MFKREREKSYRVFFVVFCSWHWLSGAKKRGFRFYRRVTMRKVFYSKKSFMLAGLCMLLLASCGGKQETGGEQGSISPEPKTEVSDGEQDTQEGDGFFVKGKAFGELPVVGKEDDIYCNLPENVLGWENEVLFCPDPLYGILYYVDHGGDNMIHAVYNGQSQVVVELPGKRLFCRGGKLYFLIETFYGFKLEGALNGNIVEYDPLTGDVTILAKEQFSSMVVYQDLIYCRQDMQSHQGEEGMYGYSPEWIYFFDTGSLKELEKSQLDYILEPQRYGKYFMAKTLKKQGDDSNVRSVVGRELRTWDGERGTVWEGLNIGSSFYIKEDSLCWLDGCDLHVYNLVSGQDQVNTLGSDDTGNFIVFDGQYYDSNFWIAGLEDGKIRECGSKDTGMKFIKEFYTDGKDIYVLIGRSNADQKAVVRRLEVGRLFEEVNPLGGSEMKTELLFYPLGE